MTSANNPPRLKSLPLRTVLAITALATVACLFACTRPDHKQAGLPEKVTIAVVKSHFPALILIAKSKDYFRDEGLDVTVQLHQTGPTAIDALFAGRVELASSAETPVMFAVTGGRRLAILAETFVSDKELAVVARKDRGIVAPSDLKGKKIAVSPRTVGEYFLHTYLAVNGISPHEVTIVKLAPPELIAALLAGKVDAASTWNPHLKKLQKELGGRVTAFSLTPPHSLMAVLSSRPDFPSQKPGTVKAILRALIKAENFAREQPRESKKIVADVIGMEPDQLGELWRSDDFRVTLDQALLLSLEFESRWAIKNGLTAAKQIPNYLELIYFDGLQSIKPDAVRILR